MISAASIVSRPCDAVIANPAEVCNCPACVVQTVTSKEVSALMTLVPNTRHGTDRWNGVMLEFRGEIVPTEQVDAVIISAFTFAYDKVTSTEAFITA